MDSQSASLLWIVVVAALIFDFANGWNDSANAIATVVSTRVLRPLWAVLIAGVLNFAGAFISVKVAKTIGGGLVDPMIVTHHVVLAAMISGALWVTVCTFLGLPISGSHSLIGGVMGAVMAGHGFDALKMGGIRTILLALLVSPILGFVLAYVLQYLTYIFASRMSPARVRSVFSRLQLVSMGYMAIQHGQNDAQKVMGVITMALIAGGHWPGLEAGIPLWVKLACAVAMGLGTAAGGWRVIRTLGMKLAHLQPIHGFAAETGAGCVLQIAASFGVPVSTTHTITGSVMGVGAFKSFSAVKWGIGTKILYAWILTFPATILLAYGLVRLLDLAGRLLP
ncbi:MAG: inorganic phosphate transporter [Nitrospirae bacterium]|nr:inorganic phosphate transporter [Nitrospirota bacterium]